MQRSVPAQLNPLSQHMPPHVWFLLSAVFHYLGPAFAVLLFPAIGILGVAWFRIATAAVFFAPMTKPWSVFRHASPEKKMLLVAMGLCLAVMNSSFYFALERLPMSLVASMEFVGTMTLTLFGLRHWRNTLALCLVIAGVVVLIDVKWASDLIGLMWAALNALLFTAYIIIGHKMAEGGAAQGIQLLGTAMAIAFLLILPFGIIEAMEAFGSTKLILAAAGVGICSSVIPYVCDQLAMARLPRASFALFMALLPVSAAVIAALVLKQIPSLQDCLAILAVVAGIAIHVPPRPINSSTNKGSRNAF